MREAIETIGSFGKDGRCMQCSGQHISLYRLVPAFRMALAALVQI